MGILDEAIREHLELKRQHGAANDELQQIEDEAFGAAARPGEEDMADPAPPDPFGEAATEFMAEAPADPVTAPPPGPAPASDAVAPPDVAEPPPEPPAPEPAPAPPMSEPAPEPPAPEPASEEHPAMEHETIPEPPTPQPQTPEPEAPEAEQSAEELDRHAIAAQPTELFDVESELAKESPSEEELYEAEAGEPRLAGDEPLDEEVDIDDDFFDEKSLSAELDQALDAPEEVPPEEVTVVEPEPEPEPEFADPEPEPEPEFAEPEPEFAEPEVEPGPTEPQALEPETAPQPEVAEPEPEREPETAEPEPEEAPSRAFFDQEEEDVLEETPDFLQDAPESDKLWFEQKPPKDFDFDD